MKELHIVSFDIPYPANYGGIIDVYFQIKALADKGIPIILHCFQYQGKQAQPHLTQLCKEVFYYKRKTGISGISLWLPYIVYSRRNPLLLERLANAEGPILFEGIHCCYYLNHKSLRNKFKSVRCLNVEHEYYDQLALQSAFPKNLYHKRESRLLRNYEQVLENADVLIPISSTDGVYFKKEFPATKATTITAFHGNDLKTRQDALGTYALFHGSLDVVENEMAVLFLVQKVFKNLNYKLIIAGKSPSTKLKKAIDKNSNLQLVADPSLEELEQLIADAQMHLMYATQSSGLKLKLLKALFHGKHVIANDLMLTEKGLLKLVERANTAEGWRQKIEILATQPFTEKDCEIRKLTLNAYHDQTSVLNLMKTLNLEI